MNDTGKRVLVPGRTCWRIEAADRVAFIIDAAEYFRHAKAAMLKAKHRIMLIGWDFDVRIEFEPREQTLQGRTGWGSFSPGCRSAHPNYGYTCSNGTWA